MSTTTSSTSSIDDRKRPMTGALSIVIGLPPRRGPVEREGHYLLLKQAVCGSTQQEAPARAKCQPLAGSQKQITSKS